MELDDILLSAVRQGDVNLLEKHLSTMTNPNLFLNRVYDEVGEQKCTLMMIACLNGHDHIIRMILHYFKPDLEILNNIVPKDAIGTQHMALNVSVLWAAAVINNLEMVKLLVQHGADVNHKTKTNSTPIRGACYNGNIEMARYLIENGADIHIAKENNETNLMLSIYRKHTDMVTYLVEELKCDVNVCSNDGRSSLYDAVNCGSLELVEFLLNRGARNFSATCDQMSPLQWAAEKRYLDLVKAISPHCSLLEQIEAKELLGSSLVCFQDDHGGIEQSFGYFYGALQLRMIHNLPKTLKSTTIEIFNHRQECQTLEQLRVIQSNTENIYIEALLVRQRILGPSNAEYRYSLRCQAARLVNNKQYHRGIVFWMYELELRRQYGILLYSDRLRQMVSVFSEMVYETLSIPMEPVIALLTLLSEELVHNKKEFSDNIYTLLFLITIISQVLEKQDISITDRGKLCRCLHIINQRRCTTSDSESSLLHLCLVNHIPTDDDIKRICKYPCLQTARILLQCGADVNAFDARKNTPMHLFTSNVSKCDESIVKLLCESGAHLDYVNARGETPLDSATSPIIKQILKSQMQIKLKCLCARLIRKNDVPFHGNVSTSLVNFVEKH